MFKDYRGKIQKRYIAFTRRDVDELIERRRSLYRGKPRKRDPEWLRRAHALASEVMGLRQAIGELRRLADLIESGREIEDYLERGQPLPSPRIKAKSGTLYYLQERDAALCERLRRLERELGSIWKERRATLPSWMR